MKLLRGKRTDPVLIEQRDHLLIQNKFVYQEYRYNIIINWNETRRKLKMSKMETCNGDTSLAWSVHATAVSHITYLFGSILVTEEKFRCTWPLNR